jgi:hypothetical protein
MKYPKIGEQVRVKNETGLHTIHNIYKWGGYPLIVLNNGRKVWLSNVVTRHQKYITVYVIQQHYGTRWEDVTQEETSSAARDRRKEYIENTNYPTRLVRRKEANPLYQEE